MNDLIDSKVVTTQVLTVDNEGKPLVNLEMVNTLPAEMQEKVHTLVNDIQMEDTQAVIQYGSAAQMNISSFSDMLLDEVKTKDTGYVAETLTNLLVEIKGVDVDGLTEKGLLDGLFGGMKKKIQKFMIGYEQVGGNLDKIISDLDKSKMTLLKDIKMLDGLYEKNLEYIQHLDLFIIAGKIKLNEVKESLLPSLHEKAVTSADPLAAQTYKDYEQMANRFEKKIHDLTLSRIIAIQTTPQIRMIQNNNQLLVEKIQSSIMNTIPLWKNQIVIAISLFRQEDALKLQQEVSKTTNELLTKNSELLKDSSIRIAKESENGIVEIETLKKVHHDLIQTLDETLQIQKDGRTKRIAAEQEIFNLEKELKKKLVEIN